uniref:Putative lipocalin n=1 Tax=Ixodes ricinus TaxID=34613 RepID=A0A6B0UCD1_IXORI
MYLQSLLVIFCLLICSYSQDTTEKPPLPEDDEENFPDQYATKAGTSGRRTSLRRKKTYEHVSRSWLTNDGSAGVDERAKQDEKFVEGRQRSH